MPIVQTGLTITAGYVTDLARALINDMSVDQAGDTLSDDQPYTFVLLNSAYQELQDELIDAGVETFTEEVVIPSLPVAAGQDPGIQVELSYSGFFDGSTTHTSLFLPSDMIQPLRLWERQSGINSGFIPMYSANDGLPSCPPQSRYGIWDWRGDAIYLCGSNQVNDLRLRYLAYAPDLIAASSPVAVLRSANVLAYDLARKYANARGATISESFKADRQEAINHIITRAVKLKQRGQHRRKPYGRRCRGSRWGR